MKKTLITFSIILNIALIYLFIIKGDTVETEDGRVEVQMTEDNRDFVFVEMRDFLESIQKINKGILTNNPKLIIEAGNKSGGSVIDHAPHGLLRSLPIGFKKLGFSTHYIFDDIAKSAEENFDKNKTQEQLNKLLINCTTCHSAFKIGLKP